MASLFWVSGSTVYDGTTNRLATTSGGTATVAVIGSADTVTFDANSPAAAAVTTSAAISCSTLTLNTGFTGSLTMSNNLTATGAVTLTAGTLNTNGQACNWGSFSSSNSNTRVLTLGASAITITQSAAPSWNTFSSTGLTINPGTAVVTFTAGSVGANLGSAASAPHPAFVFTGGGNTLFQPAGATATLANLTFTGSAVKTDIFRFNGPFTVTGTAAFTGNSAINRLLVTSTGLGVQWTITAGVTSLSNVDFMDVAGAGAAAWTGTSIGDGGGNSGITFTPSQTNYWVGGATNPWSNVNSWASSSGGVSGTGRVPLPQDTANINGSSGFSAGNTITIDMPRYGTTDFTGAPALNWSQTQASTCFGSYTVASGMTRTSSGANVITFGGRGSYTLKTANMSFPTTTMSAVSGTYTQQDNYGTGGNGFTLTAGTWDMNNFDLGTNNGLSSFFSTAASTTRQLNAYAGNIFLSLASGTTWSVTSAGLTLNITSATIVITSASTSTRTFAGGNMSYGTLTYTVANSPGQLIITGNNTFANPNIGPGRLLQFPAAGTQTITGAFNVNGANNGYLYLPGVASNYISAPDSAALEVTGDIDLRIELSLDNWAQTTAPAFIAKWTAGQLEYEFYLVTTGGGVPHLAISRDGTTNNDYGATTNLGSPAGGSIKWIRVTRATATGFVNFYTSPDGVTWTQLGATVAGVTGNLFAGTSTLFIGSNSSAGAQAVGNFYRAQVYNGIAGTLVFDANFTTKTVGANTFTESSVNAATVTINGVLAQAGDGRVAITSSTPGVASTLKASSAWNVGTNSVLVSGNTGLALVAGSIDYDTFQDITGMATVALSQVGATVTATGGTQVTVTNATVAQLAATLTATGGVQTVTASISIALAQLAATLTATGGTQVSLTNASVVQLNATLTTTGGVQATAQGVALAQVAGAVTATGGTQIGGIGVISAQVGASLTATGGVQVVIAPRIVTIAQLAAGLTATGGVQAILGTSSASMAQTGGHLTATGGVPTVGAATFTLVPMNILDSTIASDTIASESSNTEIDSSSTNINIAS